jgi:hypothetical protein
MCKQIRRLRDVLPEDGRRLWARVSGWYGVVNDATTGSPFAVSRKFTFATLQRESTGRQRTIPPSNRMLHPFEFVL